MNSKHPLVIEIEINSGCNLSCSYCPNSLENYASNFEMEESVYSLLLSQLKENGFKGKLAFDFYNEPMMAKNFNWFVSEARRVLPDSFLSLYTNGTRITSKDKLQEILDLGLGEIVVTKHEQVKKLPLENFYKDLEEQVKSKISLRGFGDLTLTNRGGSLDLETSIDSSNLPCSVPSLMMTVTYSGEVLSCFEDAYRKKSLGNIKNKNIIDIWNSNEACQFREDLLAGKRELHSICKNCSRVDFSEGKEKMEKHFIDQEEVDAVAEVLKSGELFRYQKQDGLCRKFEKALASKFGVKYAHLVTSGTNALVCALIASDIGEGDEVLIPSYTFIATASAVLMAGAIPVVCEVDDNLQLDLNHAKEIISDRTKGLIPVHMDGIACDMDAFVKFSKDHNLKLIEDACQSFGGKYKGKYLGTFGDFGCFSFNKDKIITSGDGGIVLTNDREMYEKICCISDGAFSISPHHENFFTDFNPVLGYSMRVSEITGAILNIQLKKSEMILLKYRERKKILYDALKEVDGIKIQNGHDVEGDCGITIYLSCKDANMCASIGKALRNRRVAAIPPSMRPGHVVWKWGKMLTKEAFFDKRRNPYLKTDKQYNYAVFNFLSSMDKVTKTLRVEVDIHWTIEETFKIAELIKDSIRTVK
ncbi:putative pilin glycosylation protein [Halobacteriovorax marinus SJ]|uniref:Pilin glycosylation protein n=1 Tax=Halobacteriovorax marinus (strain ATCC BAA-682 / DSM 15412 / SJ) TaxID=862908 RepID=E1WZH2_HALMS|nr:aminotransferase class I/II-fold pyridoxal phosphate-dependent enzyme [Halobacteriovorax marinus]CBW27861.1 putative pilin glycosylation protein [Halobacteriovorax marinus SJ]